MIFSHAAPYLSFYPLPPERSDMSSILSYLILSYRISILSYLISILSYLISYLILSYLSIYLIFLRAADEDKYFLFFSLIRIEDTCT